MENLVKTENRATLGVWQTTRELESPTNSMEATASGIQHLFKLTHFNKPTFCHYCSDFIWGVLSKQGYSCEGMDLDLGIILQRVVTPLISAAGTKHRLIVSSTSDFQK